MSHRPKEETIGGYDEKDAARDTGNSVRDVNRAWHQARDDAAGSGHLDERNENKVNDSEEGSTILGIIRGLFG